MELKARMVQLGFSDWYTYDTELVAALCSAGRLGDATALFYAMLTQEDAAAATLRTRMLGKKLGDHELAGRVLGYNATGRH